MKKKLSLSILLLLFVTILAGCNLPSQTQDDAAVSAQTLAAQTIEARLTENAAGQAGDEQPGDDTTTQPTDTLTPSNTPEPSATMEPSSTPKPTATPTEKPPCNQAGWVKDVTVEDGTQFGPGDTFTKTWRLKNTGSCNWNDDYDLVFDSGDKMGASSVEDIDMGKVEPGENVDISVDLTAPNTPDEYKGEWMLRSDDGEEFGLGASDTPFYVEIEVVEAVSFEITGTNVYACGMDTYVSMRIKNTGTEELESKGGSVKNMDTDAVTIYLPWDTPFTENDDDCPPMGINNMESGDVYWTTWNMGSSSGVDYKYEVTLCTEENAAGDCYSQTKTVSIP